MVSRSSTEVSKVQLLSGATVTLFPITWRAFGLVMIESMATGTPVIGMGLACARNHRPWENWFCLPPLEK